MSGEGTAEERYQDELQKRYDKLHDLYDRTVLSLSSGALVLSITFMREIVDEGPIIDRRLLGAAWTLLTAGVVAVTFSYLPSILAHEAAWTRNTGRETRMGTLAWRASVVGGLAFAAGLVFLARFAFVNL